MNVVGEVVERLRAYLGVTVRLRLRSQLRSSQRVSPAWPPMLASLLGIVASVALLVGLAYVAGARPGGHGFLRAIDTTIAKPAVALGVGAVIVVFLGACLRRLRLEVLVGRPGPISIAELSVPDDLPGVDAARLSAAFRQRLQRLRLQAPTPIPGANPAQNFLEMLDSEHLDAANPLASAVSILRSSIPSHGYEVRAALRVKADERRGPRYGVTAQVARLPFEAIPVETAWASTCEEAVTLAADIVTAAILPRTRLSQRPPWAGWRRYVMHPRLVHHYESAEDLTTVCRYDEALSHCFSALELDPKNVDIRLQKGFVEEKLKLFLDALATYAGARKVDRDSSSALYGRRARRHRAASGRVARYRLAVLLAGIDLSRQWRKPGDATLRAQQRDYLRSRLTPELLTLLADAKLIGDAAGAGPTQPPPWTRASITALLAERGTDEDTSYYALRNVFAHLGGRLLKSVSVETRHPWAPRSWLSPLSVELTRRAIALRQDWIAHRLGGGDETDWLSETAVLPSPRLFHTWTEYYNAATLYALPLLAHKSRTGESAEIVTRRSTLAALAVEQLGLAMSRATSVHVATRRDWVLSEDPDLAGLRDTPEFKHFETMYFPSAGRTPRRPDNVPSWEQARYTDVLLAETARRWEGVWRRRRESLGELTDAHAILDWCTDETSAWVLVGSVVRDRDHWKVRHDLISAMAEWGGRYGFPALGVGVPRYDAHVSVSESALQVVIEAIDDRLTRIGELVGGLAAGGDDLAALQQAVQARDFLSRESTPQFLTRVCDAREDLWHALHDWLDVDAWDDEPAHQRFRDAATQAADVRDAARSGLPGPPAPGAQAPMMVVAPHVPMAQPTAPEALTGAPGSAEPPL